MLFALVYAPMAKDSFMARYWAPASFGAQSSLAAIGKVILSGTLGAVFGLNVGSGLSAEGGAFPLILFSATAALFLVGLFRAPLFVSVSFGLTIIAATLGKWVFADRAVVYFADHNTCGLAGEVLFLGSVPPGERSTA
jgi:hypothetical protein